MPASLTSVEIKTERRFHVKKIESDVPARREVPEIEFSHPETLKFESPLKDDFFVSFIEDQILEIDKKDANVDLNYIKEDSLVKQNKPLDDYWKHQMKSSFPRDAVARETRENILETINLLEQDIIVVPEDQQDEDTIPVDFLEKMPGFTPVETAGLIDRPDSLKQTTRLTPFKPVIQRKIEHKDLKKHLDHEIVVYEDLRDGQKYYKIVIRIGPDGLSLYSVPKEIIFLVDCSISTEKQRLEEFKEGIAYCLKHLNRFDTFNIFSFKKDISKFRAKAVHPNRDNIRLALQYVDSLTVGETTDTYRALYETVSVAKFHHPTYILLLSDGRPTRGVTNPRQLINEISSFNKGKMSIFAFSGGVGVNRYLLDFISYKNRGWSEYSYRTHQIAKNLAYMYTKIRDPLLLNIRYRVSGLTDTEMFPRMLPDFFRNTEFTLYGKYDEEDKFLMQFLGDFEDKTNELMIEGSLLDAPRGDSTIARNWAFNKIYHLIGQLKHGQENTELINQIYSLSRKFKIKTPYSRSLR
ncbi:MAG: VWA domain-containing protein [Candidatus Omnitrophica bacterium]|nr:VWA domain-containing protein [Candidatus Omnitrophota bacterium]